jgi:uncharacterized YigZ family protein
VVADRTVTVAPQYYIPSHTHRTEEEILRSRFITSVAYTPTAEAARAFIATVNTEFADANHNCWAYVIGAPGSTAQIGMSDDGEPHGTAGRPMLTVLLHSNIGDICAVVTRYFGGTLLGKGGLVKAYSGGVQLALESLPVIERIPKAELTIVFDYSYVTPLQRLLTTVEAQVIDEEYATDVSYHISLPSEQIPAFTDAFTTLTNGQGLLEITSIDQI